MEIYKQIRRMRLQGMSQRQIATSLHISRNTVKKYWDGDSVPWERKGMPRALIEAMSNGCPCIASNAGGMPELLSKEFIYKKGNARQLVSIIKNADENGLYAQGSRNADYAQNFLPEVLKTTREHFYTEFKSIIDESGT